MSTEPETAAAEAVPAPPQDLSGPDAGGETAAAPLALATADGPESLPEPPQRVSLRELGARIAVPLHVAPLAPYWSDLWAQFDQAERDNAAGDNQDGHLLNAWYAQAQAATFPPRRRTVAA